MIGAFAESIGHHSGNAAIQLPLPEGSRFHHWPARANGASVSFYRVDDAFLIRVEALADFRVSKTGHEVTVTPVPNVSSERVDDAYRNLVVPLMQSQQGKLVFHASAVEADGHALVFLAESGAGKSTLASGLTVDGCRLLADDHVCFEPCETGYQVIPAGDAIRLWQDSFEQIGALVPGVAVAKNSMNKWQVSPGDIGSRDSKSHSIPRRVKHIYVLVPGSEPGLRPLSPQAAVVRLLNHQFLLDMADRESLSRNLLAVTSVARKVAAFEFCLPHDFQQFEKARDKILEHARESDPSWKPESTS